MICLENTKRYDLIRAMIKVIKRIPRYTIIWKRRGKGKSISLGVKLVIMLVIIDAPIYDIVVNIATLINMKPVICVSLAPQSK